MFGDERQNKMRLGLMLAGIALGGAAYAEEAGRPPGGMSDTIEELVVTAQKREQSMQDVGIAVTSFSDSDIRELGMLRPEDLAAQTPGLDIKNSLGNHNPVFTLRGVGLNDYNVNNNPSVGVYVDEVYMASGAYLSFQIFDMERVEVLKGPQGTLYGRNTTGGAINFLTAKPTDELEAYVDLDYGRWNTLKLEGAVSGPLGDTISGRLAFQMNRSDGYYKNNGNAGSSAGLVAPSSGGLQFLVPIISGGALIPADPQEAIPPNPLVEADDDFFEQDNFALRGTVDWDISDAVDLTVSLHYGEDKGDMLVRSLNGTDTAGFTPADDDPFTVDSNNGVGGPEVDIEAFGGYAKLDADLGFATLTSITGYETIERVLPFEESSPWRLVDQLFMEDMSEFSQEIRLASNDAAQVFWMVGLYYGKEDIEAGKDLNGLDGGLSGFINTSYEQDRETFAAFAHTEWQVAETVRLTGGIRYTADDNRYAGGSFIPEPPLGIYGTNAGGVVIGLPYYDDRSFDEDNVSGKVGIDWTPQEDLLFYLSWNKGYKSGGFDGSTITDESAFTPFRGEDLYAWEAGMKSRWADNRVQLNLTAFLYDFEDMQAEGQREVFPGTFESIRANVGESEIWGIEAELWLKPAAGLDVKLGLAYLDTEITDWAADGLDSDDPDVVADAIADVEAHVGNEVPDSPELTFNGLLRYQRPLSDGLNITGMFNFNFVDDVYKNIDNDEHLRADSYWLLNARLAISSADERWEAAIWGKNLADEFYYRERFDNFGPSWIYETPGAPRSYGVNVVYRW